MAFAITGRDEGRFLSVVRTQPAGAEFLARSWVRSGITDIRIDWNGRVYSLAAFRGLFETTRNGWRLRSAQ